MRAASTALAEAGIKDALIEEWEGVSIPQNTEVETMVLTNGQTILIFLVILMSFGCSILILFCEIKYKNLMDYKKANVEKIWMQMQGIVHQLNNMQFVVKNLEIQSK